jgi:hypothetical protein
MMPLKRICRQGLKRGWVIIKIDTNGFSWRRNLIELHESMFDTNLCSRGELSELHELFFCSVCKTMIIL